MAVVELLDRLSLLTQAQETCTSQLNLTQLNSTQVY